MQTKYCWTHKPLFGVEPVKIPAIRVLSELPIACHRAEVDLRGIHIYCFPMRDDHDNYAMLNPVSSSSPSWENLRSACQGLETFTFSPGGSSVPQDHIAPASRSHIDGYIGAVISGHNLRRVDISLRRLGVVKKETDWRGEYPFGHTLMKADWPRLEELRLSELSFGESEFERFCDGLGDENLKSVNLDWIRLYTGLWADGADILRQRLARKSKDGTLDLRLGSPLGGEFGLERLSTDASEFVELWEEELDVDIVEEVYGEPRLVAQARRYILGDKGIPNNPLSKIKRINDPRRLPEEDK
jgi:hypothetical protein